MFNSDGYENILEGVPIELKLLIDLNNGNSLKLIDSYKEKEFDWFLFQELVIHHRLFPGLNSKIKKNEEVKIPVNLLKTLEAWNQINTLKMLNLTAELVRINQLLNSNNIRALFLKGPFLGEILYGDLSLRTSSDIDLLVPFENLDEAEEILGQIGFVKDDYIESVLSDWKWRHHHFSFIHPSTQVKIEVHWRLSPGPGKEPSFETLWSNRNTHTYSEVTISYLGNEELFFFLVTHGARHGWSRLRWLLDIHQLMINSLDWFKVRKLFNRYSNLSVAGQALILSNKLFNTSIEEVIFKTRLNSKKSIRLAKKVNFYLKDMINLHNEPLPEEVSYYHKNYLVQIKSLLQKSMFYLSFLYPYPEDASFLPLPKKVHFLYFLLRPIIWILRKPKKIITQGAKG